MQGKKPGLSGDGHGQKPERVVVRIRNCEHNSTNNILTSKWTPKKLPPLNRTTVNLTHKFILPVSPMSSVETVQCLSPG